MVEDDKAIAESVGEVLNAKGHEVVTAEDGDYALDLLENEDFDVVLTDFRMPVMGGMEVLESVRKIKPKLPVIMMTAFSTADRAIEAVKKGAFDYLIKPFEMPDLLEVLEKAIACSRLTAKPVSFGEETLEGDAIIGKSRRMQEVFKDVGRVAEKPVTVLIKGETGTGKELIARAIYQHSDRTGKPFVAINCAAIPANLIESELFGHERGAFTNAVARRIGRFEQADGGTLFLDEIGDLPPETQVKLLRVLQEKVICRVGSKEEIPVDVRVISATHQNLEEMVAAGEFREDLYYRLNASVIEIPPLRERREDIPLLAHYFLARYAAEFSLESPSLHKSALKVLEEHDWPGNVRQLENVVRGALIEAQGFTISENLIRQALEESPGIPLKGPESDGAVAPGFTEHIRRRLLEASRGELEGAYEKIVEDVERELYSQAVEVSHGHQTNIAQWLGVSRLTVREKLDKYQLFPKRKAGGKGESS